MKITLLILSIAILAFACVKHATVAAPLEPTCSGTQTYTYCAQGRSEWVVLSKSGPHDKELCPHGAVCTIETLGTMYRIRRVH